MVPGAGRFDGEESSDVEILHGGATVSDTKRRLGWHLDPDQPGMKRRWDGGEWVESKPLSRVEDWRVRARSHPFLFVLFLILVVVVGGALVNRSPSTKSPGKPNWEKAITACQAIVLQSYQSPSFVFDDTTAPAGTDDLGQEMIRVTGHANAKNAYGVKVGTAYACDVTFLRNGKVGVNLVPT